MHTHTRTHARMYARTHSHTHARTHARTQHTHTHTQIDRQTDRDRQRHRKRQTLGEVEWTGKTASTTKEVCLESRPERMSLAVSLALLGRALHREQRTIYISKLAGHNYDFVLPSLGPGTSRRRLARRSERTRQSVWQNELGGEIDRVTGFHGRHGK